MVGGVVGVPVVDGVELVCGCDVIIFISGVQRNGVYSRMCHGQGSKNRLRPIACGRFYHRLTVIRTAPKKLRATMNFLVFPAACNRRSGPRRWQPRKKGVPNMRAILFYFSPVHTAEGQPEVIPAPEWSIFLSFSFPFPSLAFASSHPNLS